MAVPRPLLLRALRAGAALEQREHHSWALLPPRDKAEPVTDYMLAGKSVRSVFVWTV